MARDGRPIPMDKAGTHQPAARRSINSGNKNSNQLSFPPTLDGGNEEDEDEGDDDHDDDHDQNYSDDDDDDDDEPKTSDEEHFSLATSHSEDLIEMQNFSSLQFSPTSSMAPPECRWYPPYQLNASQHSGLVSTPPSTTTSMPLNGVPAWAPYHEHANFEGVGPSTSPPLTIQDTQNFWNGETSPAIRRWSHSELTRQIFQDLTPSHYLTVIQREPLWPAIRLLR